MNPINTSTPIDREWLERAVAAEERFPSFSVGGLASDMGWIAPPKPQPSPVSALSEEESRACELAKHGLAPHISLDPQIHHGQPCIRAIPIHQIIRMLASGDTVEGLLEDYPNLTREDIAAALNYAASLVEQQVPPPGLAA